MNNLPRWIAFASVPVVLALKQTATYAFTDENAALKEAAADRNAVVTAVAAARVPAPPRPTAWVPMPAKTLDGFRPVFAEERLAGARSRATVLAQAAAPASAAGRR